MVNYREFAGRLFFDKRPQNIGGRRLGWAHLPHGSQLTGKGIRGSGDDWSAFLQWLEHDNNLARSAFGGRVPPDEVERYGFAPGRYRAALLVLAMG